MAARFLEEEEAVLPPVKARFVDEQPVASPDTAPSTPATAPEKETVVTDNSGRIPAGGFIDRLLGGTKESTEKLRSEIDQGTAAVPAEIKSIRPMVAMPAAKAIDAVVQPISGGRAIKLADLVLGTTREPTAADQPIPEIPAQEGTIAQIGAGAGNVPIRFANFALSPEGVALGGTLGLVPKIVRTLTGLIFAGEEVRAAATSDTLQEQLSHALGAAAIGAGTGIDALSGKRPAISPKAEEVARTPVEAPEVQPATLPREAVETQPQPATAIERPVTDAVLKPATEEAVAPAQEVTPVEPTKIVAPEGATPPKPATQGEQVISTAIRDPATGEVKVGSTWNEAHDGVAARHGLETVAEETKGFLVQDASGVQRFATREEAATVAKTAGQVPATAEGKLYSEGLIEIPKGASERKIAQFRDEPVRVRLLSALNDSLRSAERAGQAGFKRGVTEAKTESATQIQEIKGTFKTADKWLEADANQIRKNLLSFADNLPLHERGKFIPAITSAVKRAPITSRDPGIMYRRAETVLNRMTEAVYNVRKKEVSVNIEKLVSKVDESPSVAVGQKESVRQIATTFNNLKDKMSLDMLSAMKERIGEIEARGRDLFTLDRVIREEQTKAAVREIAEQGTKKIDLPERARAALGETETSFDRYLDRVKNIPNSFRHFNLSLTPMDWMIQTFDGRPNGAIYRTMKLPVDVRYGEYLDTTHAYKQRLSQIVSENKLDPGNLDRIYAHAELRQEGGLENLKAMGLTEAEINSARTLTKGERAYLKEADKINNELFPVLKEVLAKDFNQEVGKVEGYFPRQRDWDYYNALSIEEGKFAKSFNRSNTEKGFTVERTGAVTRNKTNAHEVMMNHVDDVLYHIKLGPEIRRVANIVKDSTFKDNVGSWGQEVFSDWVDVLSRNGGVSGARKIRAMDVLRKNVGMAQLAFRLTTTALQPTALIQGMALVSPRNMSVALSRMALKSNRDFVLKNFPEVRARVGDDPAYSDYGGASVRDKLARGGFKAISLLDRFAAMTVAEGAYRDFLSKKGATFNPAVVDLEGVQYAQSVVRKTQSTPFAKDVPLALSRGNFSGNASVDRAIFQFQNFLINKWALVKNGGLQMGIKEKSPSAGARIMTFIVLGTIVEQMQRDGIKKAVRYFTGSSKAQEKQEKKNEEKSYARRIGEKAAVDLVTSIPVVSNVAGMVQYEGSGIPLVDVGKDAVEGAVNLARGKSETTKLTGGIKAVQALGALGGIPTGQAGDIAVQAVRGMEPKKEPKKSTNASSRIRRSRE